MAKIEKPQAVQRIDEIMAVADAVMVARGDLGVEMPLERVPGIQKTLTRLARRAGASRWWWRRRCTRIDDHRPGADPRRSLRRRDRGVRGRRRGDAVGRERVGPISDRGGGDHEPGSRKAVQNRRGSIPRSSRRSERRRRRPRADAIAEATRHVAETLDLKVICAWTSSGSAWACRSPASDRARRSWP